MIKKSVLVLLLAIFLLFSTVIISAQFEKTIVNKSSGMNPENPFNLPTDINQVTNKSKERWDYISKEWQSMLLKNKIIASIDLFMKKLDRVFVYAMGEHYSLSLTFFAILLMWILFGSRFGEFLSSYFEFKGGTRALAWIGSGAAFSLILSHTGIYRFILTLPSYWKNVAWWLGIILWIVFIAAVVFAYIFLDTIREFQRKQKERRVKAQEQQEREELHRVVKGVRQAAG